MMFTIKQKDEKDRSVEFEKLEELLAFIMGADCSVTITPDWQSKSWDLELNKE
jgi:hypothetical protein